MEESLDKLGFKKVSLDANDVIWHGCLPSELITDQAAFDLLWALHPDNYHRIIMHGKSVRTPRWQQAYGKDYYYTGQTNQARSIPDSLAPYLQWTQSRIDKRLNGLLLNWYDGSLGHYIGRHRDNSRDLVLHSPIITISLGESRIFRLRLWGCKAKVTASSGFYDLNLVNGSVVVLPYATNQSWTHEIPKLARFKRRRISITVRAFIESS